MTGTLASLTSRGAPSIPQPTVRIQPQGNASGVHDVVHVGGLLDTQFDAIKDLNPRIWLFRYKGGFSSNKAPHSGYNYDNTRGYVHPSHWVGGQVKNHIGGGNHTTRNGATIDDRPSVWPLTGPHRYDAVFNAENWFKDINTKAYSWPIQKLANNDPNAYAILGLSGQSNNNAGSYNSTSARIFCNSTRTRGTQVQWFAFAVVIDDASDPRNFVVGPMSEVVKAEIWPRIRVGYGACGISADKGRKIRVRHA